MFDSLADESRFPPVTVQMPDSPETLVMTICDEEGISEAIRYRTLTSFNDGYFSSS